VTSRRSATVYGALVRLYPRSFRDEYGSDLVQDFRALAADRGIAEAWRRSAIDLLVTVPRYRLETAMPAQKSTTVLRGSIVALASAGVVSVVVGLRPGVIFLAVAIALAVGQRSTLARSMRDPDEVRARARIRIPMTVPAGAIALAAAVFIPAIDGGELDEAWWTVMAACGLVGVGLLVAGALTIFTAWSASATS
jgi:hypothetical protein